MLIMRATDEAYAAFKDVDFNQIIESVGRFNDEMISAGVLVAAEGIDDASQGVVVDNSRDAGSSRRAWSPQAAQPMASKASRASRSGARDSAIRRWRRSHWPCASNRRAR